MLDEIVERRLREHRAAARSQTAGASSLGAALPRDQMRTAVLAEVSRDDVSHRDWLPYPLASNRRVLAEADIVCATLSGAGSPAVLEAARSGALRFAALVIDEAAQVCAGVRCVCLAGCFGVARCAGFDKVFGWILFYFLASRGARRGGRRRSSTDDGIVAM